MTGKTKDVEVVKKPQEANEISVFIEKAIASNAPVETMERLFALHEKVKAGQSKEAFIEALSRFQEVCPTIKKTQAVKNKDGSLRYMFAPMDSIIKQIKTPLAASKLSYTWDTKHENDHMSVTCKLTHVFGHSETSTIEIPVENSQYMTKPQSYATAQTYAKRYTLLNALGIGTADEDTDATDAKEQKLAKSDKAKIVTLLRGMGHATATKKDIESSVKILAGLALTEENYGEIVSRLEVVATENNEDNKVSK